MTYTRLYRSFRKFVDLDEHFTEAEQEKILHSFEDSRNQKIFRLSIILLVWSTLGIFADSTLIGGGVLASIFMGVKFKFFIPTILFSIINFFAKYFFVQHYMQKNISKNHASYCGIPYAGSAILLGSLLKDDPLFLEGLKHYLKYLRKRGFQFLCNKIKHEKNCSH
ncbi:MAG: hypothetical protein ACJAV6_000159 [Candidatus Paceibacteria bacterium]|jgi:hypothetical protein